MATDRAICITERLEKSLTSSIVYGFASLPCYNKVQITLPNHCQVSYFRFLKQNREIEQTITEIFNNASKVNLLLQYDFTKRENNRSFFSILLVTVQYVASFLWLNLYLEISMKISIS